MSDFENKKEGIDPNISDFLINEHLNCTYLCFKVEPSIYDERGFEFDKGSSSKLLLEQIKIDKNIVILCVYCEGFLNLPFTLFKNEYYFKINYKFKNKYLFSCNFDLTVEKNKIKLIYNTANKGTIYGKDSLLRIPSYLEQYKTYKKIIGKNDILFGETKDFLLENFNFELFLYLLQDNKEKREELMNMLSNFPNLKITYEKDKSLHKMDFFSLSNNPYYKLLILIYSVIQDSIELITDFKQDDFLEIIKYNEIGNNQPFIIKKNIFEFFIGKINQERLIKKLCQNVSSIPTLFDYLICLKEEKLEKVKNLAPEDLPLDYSLNYNVIDLIEKYEKIKGAFQENTIIKVLKSYSFNNKRTIKELENIIEKLNSTDNKNYWNLIEEIKSNIINKGKKMIKNNEMKSLDMYIFINKYNTIGEFLSDDYLIYDIGRNIIVEHLNSDENILIEFNKCNFLSKINPKLVYKFLNGILSQIYNYQKFYLFFKFIYLIKKVENNADNLDSINLIISRFIELLNNFSDVNINEEFKIVFQKIIILSLMYIQSEKNNNYKIIIKELRKSPLYSKEEIFDLLIEKIINLNLDDYISCERKEEFSIYIIETFYFDLNIDKKIDFLLKIESSKLKEEIIYIKFPKLNFSDFFSGEENESFNYLKHFIKKGIINKEEFSKSDYFKQLKLSCNSIQNILENRKINFSDINKLKELIQNKKISQRIYCICLGDSKLSEEIEKKINEYTEKYINYNSQLDTIIRYYNKYYPNSKQNEIDEYSQQQQYFKESQTNINEIKINETIKKENLYFLIFFII